MTSQKAVTMARQIYADPSDNDIEIDEDPVVNEGEEGYWVAAWVYVRKDPVATDEERSFGPHHAVL